MFIDIEVSLFWSFDAVSPMKSCIEPLGRVGSPHLEAEHGTHFVKEHACGIFVIEVLRFPTPVSPSSGKTPKYLPSIGLCDESLFFWKFFECFGVCGFSGEPRRDIFFFDGFESCGYSGLAEVFLCHDIDSDLAPRSGSFDSFHGEDFLPVASGDFGSHGSERDGFEGVFPVLGETAFNFHTKRPSNR